MLVEFLVLSQQLTFVHSPLKQLLIEDEIITKKVDRKW